MAKPKILFIKTPVPMLKDDKLEPDMGLLYCASYVKKHCDVKPVYIDLSIDKEEIIYQHARQCNIFCFSSFTANYHITREIRHRIQQVSSKESVFIVGGHHASALPDEVKSDFDYVIVGEGELALVELINNLVTKKRPENGIITGKCIYNLDDIGWIDYSLVQLHKYTRRVKGKKSISILTSRGCPYSCNFCNSTLMKKYRTVRFRSAIDVVEEIIFLHEKYGFTSFRIQDDIFSINRNRLEEIAEKLEDYKLSFRCFARIDNIDEDILTCFKRMGVFHLSFGIESGSQRMLDLMNKGITVEDIQNGVALVKKYQMKCRVYLIVGYPGETIESLNETIELIRKIQPDDVSVYPLLPYPGTDLFNNPSKYGITFIDLDFSNYYQVFGNKQSGYVFETADMNIEKLQFYRNYLVSGIADVCSWAIDDEDNR